MADIQTRVKLTEEEKRKKKAIYMAQYMKNKRMNDPEFAEKQREYCRACNKKQYLNDEKRRLDISNRSKDMYKKLKEAYNILQQQKH